MKIRKNVGQFLAGVTLLTASGAALATGTEVGLITQATGAVQVMAPGSKATPAVSFAKLKAGSKVSIGSDGRFQVVYLNSGRQESWAGGSEIEVGENASKPIKAKRLPAVKQLSPLIMKGLTQAPAMIANMKSRQGMIRVRAVADWEKAEEAEKNYKMLRTQVVADDVTPELYLLAVLSELKLYDKMKQPLDEMISRQPGNEEISAMHAAYLEQMAKGSMEKK